MSRYRRVETGTFGDAKFRELSAPPPSARYLWINLLCGKRTTIWPGVVLATDVVLASDLEWPLSADLFGANLSGGPRSFREAWRELEERGMARADWSAGVIVLPRALLDRRGAPRDSAKPTSPNAFMGWVKEWDQISECDLKDWYLAELERFAVALDDQNYEARIRAQAERKPSGRRRVSESSVTAPTDHTVDQNERSNAYHAAYIYSFGHLMSTTPRRVGHDSETRARGRALPVPVLLSNATSVPGLGSVSSILPSGASDLGGGGDRDHGAMAGVARAAGEALATLPESAWSRRKRWWDAALAAHRRLRDGGLSPNAPDLLGFATASEAMLAKCERHLAESGLTPEQVDAKMLHVIAVAERRAVAQGKLDYFKPVSIFDMNNERPWFLRFVEMSLEQASESPGTKAADRGSAFDASARALARLNALEGK